MMSSIEGLLPFKSHVQGCFGGRFESRRILSKECGGQAVCPSVRGYERLRRWKMEL